MFYEKEKEKNISAPSLIKELVLKLVPKELVLWLNVIYKPIENGIGRHLRTDIFFKCHINMYILSRATYHRAPRYGFVRTWVEGLLAHGTCVLAEASNQVGYSCLTLTMYHTITRPMVGHNDILGYKYVSFWWFFRLQEILQWYLFDGWNPSSEVLHSDMACYISSCTRCKYYILNQNQWKS